MVTRTAGQLVFVLHVRPYRETSAIVELLSRDHGRISVVARGARGPRRKGAERLVPFVRLLVGWSGRGQLRTLTACEALEHRWLTGRALYAGLYLNELLVRLLRSDDPHAELFAGYEAAIVALAEGAAIEPELRRFEKLMLKECGYELVFDRDADSGEPVSPDGQYRLEPDHGFCRANNTDADVLYPGEVLLAISGDRFDDPVTRRAAKRIMRQMLEPHLGGRPLRSRTLFRRATRSR